MTSMIQDASSDDIRAGSYMDQGVPVPSGVDEDGCIADEFLDFSS